MRNRYITVSWILLLIMLLIGSSQVVLAQQPIVVLRADSLLRADTSGRVTEWRSTADSAAFTVGVSSVAPLLVPDGMNGKPTVRFANDGYLEGPNVFPVLSDYTLYVVMNWSGGSASNNLVSGSTRALYLGNAPYARVLHKANFNQQAVSTVAVDGPTVIRVTYEHSTGLARIAVNNMAAGEAVVPENTDPSIFIGSYARGNFFWGDISEVRLYGELIDSSRQFALETDLHGRYNIVRQPDPPTPVIAWERVVSPLQFVYESDTVGLRGTVTDGAVSGIRLQLDSNGITVEEWEESVVTDEVFDWTYVPTAGLHTYHLRVWALTNSGLQLLELDADGILCGEVIAIDGQSNSIFGDATQTPSPYARTFGSNFGNSLADTLYKSSIATGNGGGANVGAWGLHMQNLVSVEDRMPTCVINGGVGGTTIQQHFPDTNNRMNVGTIYGSWLYRLQKSGLRDKVRWLFWYQGESNSGSEEYIELFRTLYAAWELDLPALEHIVVVQIRPGCGGTEHARLRDDQRRLEEEFPKVMVHTAAGLPGHDGCHFASAGYRLLGEQLYRIYRDTENGIEESDARAPTIDRARRLVDSGDVVLTFKRCTSIAIGSGDEIDLRSAFFFNANEEEQPDSAWIIGTTVVLRPKASSVVSTVSYVPDKNATGTSSLYAGPWLYDEVGVSALTFHNVPVLASGVPVQQREQVRAMGPLRPGDLLPVGLGVTQASLYSVAGERIEMRISEGVVAIPERISTGVYILVMSTEQDRSVAKVFLVP